MFTVHLHRRLRNSRRVEKIVRVLLKYGFKDFADRLALGKRLVRRLTAMEPKPDSFHFNRSIRIRQALEELGPTYVKLGQLFSNRSDILPPEIIEELARLQDAVPPFPIAQVEAIVAEELNGPIKELYASFDPQACASASISQVHEAWLHNGRRVAVKVQRPGIRQVIEEDLEVLAHLAKLVVKHIPESRPFDPEGMINEFRKEILQELDFTREAMHIDQFTLLDRRNQTVVVPGVYRQLSGERILTMDFIQGTKLRVFMEQADKDARSIVAKRLASSMLEQVFINGFFHADPHPGNILILPEQRICFLDFGMMGRLNAKDREKLGRVLASMVANDANSVTDALEDILGYGIQDRDSFQDEVQDLIDLYMTRALESINISRILEELIRLMRLHKIIVPTKFMLIARAFMIAEGVGSDLSPHFSFMAVFGPFSRRLLAEQLKPRTIRRHLVEHSQAYTRALRDFPLDLASLAKQLRKGEARIGFRVQGIDPLKDTLDDIGTRFTYALLLAAVLIASSVVIHSKVPPVYNELSLIGIAGFGVAGVMSLGFLVDLVVRIARRSRKKGD